MTEPNVCCVLLTADRQQFTDRALRSYQQQTYTNRRLLIYDTGIEPYYPNWPQGSTKSVEICRSAKNGRTIGALRNGANAAACSPPKGREIPDIIVHWDSDDWSYPNRITEQVEALQVAGRECSHGETVVGSRGMWFWDVTNPYNDDGEAWYYLNQSQHYCVCSSMAYWRSAWERMPFADADRAESKPLLGDQSIGFMDRCWVIGQIHEGNRAYYDEARKPGNIGFARGASQDDLRISAIMETA